VGGRLPLRGVYWSPSWGKDSRCGCDVLPRGERTPIGGAGCSPSSGGGKTPHGCNAWTRDEAMSEPMRGNVWVDECMDKGKDEYMNE